MMGATSDHIESASETAGIDTRFPVWSRRSTDEQYVTGKAPTDGPG